MCVCVFVTPEAGEQIFERKENLCCMLMRHGVCVCLRVYEIERERERESVCVRSEDVVPVSGLQLGHNDTLRSVCEDF